MINHCHNAVDNFGFWGLSWNGALVLYSIWVYVDPDIYDMRQETMYIDHINALDNKQFAACFLPLIEAILKFVKRILLHITRMIIQCDKSIFYQNFIVPFFINILNKSNGPFVSQYIHTYTSAGKGIIGGNFTSE